MSWSESDWWVIKLFQWTVRQLSSKKKLSNFYVILKKPKTEVIKQAKPYIEFTMWFSEEGINCDIGSTQWIIKFAKEFLGRVWYHNDLHILWSGPFNPSKLYQYNIYKKSLSDQEPVISDLIFTRKQEKTYIRQSLIFSIPRVNSGGQHGRVIKFWLWSQRALVRVPRLSTFMLIAVDQLLSPSSIHTLAPVRVLGMRHCKH